MLRSMGLTWKERPICGNAVAMTVPSRFSMKNAPATRMAIDVEFRSGIATSRTDSKRVSTSHGKSASLCFIVQQPRWSEFTLSSRGQESASPWCGELGLAARDRRSRTANYEDLARLTVADMHSCIQRGHWIISKHRMSLRTRHKRNPKLALGMLILCQVSARRDEKVDMSQKAFAVPKLVGRTV